MRQKIKEFIKQRGLRIVFLHSETGIHTTTLSKFLKTDKPVKPIIISKILGVVKKMGFTDVDFDCLLKMLAKSAFSVDYSTDERCTVSSYNCEDEVIFNPKLIKEITYSPQENEWLLCEVLFFNGSRIVFNHMNFKTTL
jgi:hypothetical protein